MFGEDRLMPKPDPVASEDLGRILILDDEEMLLEVLQESLERLGFQVLSALSARQALERMETYEGEIRAAVLDLNVPGEGGGRTLVLELRRRFPRIYAVATSGNDSEPAMRDPAAYGFDASLEKPFRLEDLRRILQTLLPTT